MNRTGPPLRLTDHIAGPTTKTTVRFLPGYGPTPSATNVVPHPFDQPAAHHMMSWGTSVDTPPIFHAPARPSLTRSPLAIDLSYNMGEEALRQDRPLGYPPRDNIRGHARSETPQMPSPIPFDSACFPATVFPSRATSTLTQWSSAVSHQNTSLQVLSQPQHASNYFPHSLHTEDDNPPDRLLSSHPAYRPQPTGSHPHLPSAARCSQGGLKQCDLPCITHASGLYGKWSLRLCHFFCR